MRMRTQRRLTLLKLGAPSVLGAPSASLSIPSKESVIALRSATGGAILFRSECNTTGETHCPGTWDLGTELTLTVGWELTLQPRSSTGIWQPRPGKLVRLKYFS